MNKKFRIVLIFIFLFLSVRQSAAQPIFNLKKSIQKTLKSSYRIAELTRELKYAHAHYDYISRFYLPSNIELNQYTKIYGKGNNIGYTGNISSKWSIPLLDFNNNLQYSGKNNFSDNLEINIYENDVYFALIQAKLDLLTAKQNFYLQKQKLIVDVITNYFDYIAAERKIQINKNALALAQKYLKREKLYFKAGIKIKYDVLKAAVQVANLQGALKGSYYDLSLAKEALRYIIGIETDKSITIDTNIAELKFNFKKSLKECIKTGLNNRIDVALAKMRTVAAKKQLRYLVSKRWIIPTLKLNYTKSNNYTNNNFELDIGVNIPIYNRKTVLQDMLKARLNYNKSLENADIAKQNIIFNIKSAYFNMQKSRNSINSLDKSITEAKENLRIEELRYKTGSNKKTMDFLEKLKIKLGSVINIDLSANLFNAQNNLILLESDYYEQLSNYYVAVANLYTAMGLDFNTFQQGSKN